MLVNLLAFLLAPAGANPVRNFFSKRAFRARGGVSEIVASTSLRI